MDWQKYKEKLQENKVVLLAIGLILLGISLIAYTTAQKNADKPEGPVQVCSPAEDTRGVLVLNYHKIDNKHHSLSVRVADFEQHMAWLKQYGYTSITPDELYDFITCGAELPEKPVMITFDDGYEDNYTNAYPIMKKYGFTGTIFVVTSFLGKYPNYLTWAQAQELEENGFNIESHTVTHQSMTDASDEKIKKELEDSKAAIQEHLGKESKYFAYPTGTYNLHIAQMAKDAGYRAAFTIKFDNVSRQTNVYAIERVPIFHTENTNKDFLERIQSLPLTDKYGWEKK